MNERFLIINADDFGLTAPTNEAIAELFSLGAITSSTILTPARYAAEACAMSADKQYPVGVHWTLHAEWASEPWFPVAGASAPSLIDEGKLFSDASAMAKAAKAGDVTRELEAQYHAMVAQGVVPDHADSHAGTLYGINKRLFFCNAFRLCRKYRLPFRFPKGDRFLERQFGRPPSALLRMAHRTIVATAALYGVPLLDDFISDPRHVAQIKDYDDLCDFYKRELRAAGTGITEVFMHPAKSDAALLARTPEWRKQEWEYEFLKSGEFNRLAEAEGFKLVSWGEAFRRN